MNDQGSLFTLEAFIAGTIVVVTLFFLFSEPLDYTRFGEETLTYVSYDCLNDIDLEDELREELTPHVTENLASYWNFETENDDIVYDLQSDNDGEINNDSEINNDNWNVEDGRQVFEFDNDVMEVEENSSLKNLSSLTVEAHVKPYEDEEDFLTMTNEDYEDYTLTVDEVEEWNIITDEFNDNFNFTGELVLGNVNDGFEGYVDYVRIYDSYVADDIEELSLLERINSTAIENLIDQQECFTPLIEHTVRICDQVKCTNVDLPENKTVSSASYFVTGHQNTYYPVEIILYTWEYDN